MKQALTTGGQLSVWYAAAQSALDNLGVVDIISDTDIPSLKGAHPDFGDVEILFFVPEENKIRMEITFSDPQIYSEFKKAVVPEYKTLFMALAREQQSEPVPVQTETQAPAAQADEAAAPEAEAEQAEEPVAEPIQSDKADESNEPAPVAEEPEPIQTKLQDEPENVIIPEEEPKTTEAPKKGKGKKVGIIIAAVLVIALLAGAAVYYFVFRNKSTSDPNSTKSDPTQVDPAVTENQPVGNVVTSTQYDEIQNGLTYQEVCAKFGSEGTLLSETTTEDGGVLKIYYWNGKGENGAYASVSFQDDVAVTKTASGLQPAQE